MTELFNMLMNIFCDTPTVRSLYSFLFNQEYWINLRNSHVVFLLVYSILLVLIYFIIFIRSFCRIKGKET